MYCDVFMCFTPIVNCCIYEKVFFFQTDDLAMEDYLAELILSVDFANVSLHPKM